MRKSKRWSKKSKWENEEKTIEKVEYELKEK